MRRILSANWRGESKTERKRSNRVESSRVESSRVVSCRVESRRVETSQVESMGNRCRIGLECRRVDNRVWAPRDSFADTKPSRAFVCAMDADAEEACGGGMRRGHVEGACGGGMWRRHAAAQRPRVRRMMMRRAHATLRDGGGGGGGVGCRGSRPRVPRPSC